MTYAEPALEVAREARRTGLAGSVPLGVLWVHGPDAASFLQSSLTNEVQGLGPGQGNLNARVDRTARLGWVFSLHVVSATPPVYALIIDRDQVQGLAHDLDKYQFAEQVTLDDRTDALASFVIQGPSAAAVLTRVLGDAAAWDALPEGSIQAIDGGWVVARSLTGDPGFIVLADDPTLTGRLSEAALAAGLSVPQATELAAALEILRIESGGVRVGPDTAGPKSPLLPETGLEQAAVSYSKGCYLGQEVIARVRTYGSVKHALRALVFKGADASLLDALPAPGEPVVLTDGTTVGRFASRAWSVVLEAPVAYAYVDRAHRTPGTSVSLGGALDSVHAEVTLLPLYRGRDLEARVQQRYDRAVRTFAAGDDEGAMALLQEALALDPGFADGYEVLGVILGRTGRLHEAIDFFRRLEELSPTEPMVNTNLSIFYMKLGDKSTAESEAAKAMEKSFLLGQSGGDGRSAAEIAREQDEARRADAHRKAQMFRQVIAIDAEDPVAWFGLGRAQITLGDWEQASASLQTATTLDRDNSAAWLAWGKALEALGQPEQALDVYRRGREVASRRGDLMPLQEMEHRALLLRATASEPAHGG